MHVVVNHIHQSYLCALTLKLYQGNFVVDHSFFTFS